MSTYIFTFNLTMDKVFLSKSYENEEKISNININYKIFHKNARLRSKKFKRFVSSKVGRLKKCF